MPSRFFPSRDLLARISSTLLLAALATICSVAPALAQDEFDNPLDEALAAGEAAMEEENYSEALLAFNSAIQMVQQAGMYDPRGLDGRARAYVELGNYDSAETDFQMALDYTQNKYVPTLVHRGQMWLDRGMYGDALGDFEEALKIDPTDLEAQFGLGKANIMVGGYLQGVASLDRYIEQNEENAEAYQLRAQAQAGMGNYEEAMADLGHSIDLEPENHENYYILSRIYMNQENYGPAIAAVDQAIANYTPPEGTDLPYIEGYLMRASAELDFGKTTDDPTLKKMGYDGAIASCDEVLAMTDENDYSMYGARAAAEYSRALAYRFLGQFGKAIESFSEALRMNPNIGGGEAYLRRGICFHYIGEDDLAVEDFEQAASIQFDDPRARLWQGFAYVSLEDFHKAIKAYGQAIAADNRFTTAYVNRGLAYMSLGDYQKAIQNFNQAIRLEPTNWNHYFKRGVAMAQLDEHEKAAKSYATSLEFNNENAGTYRQMAASMEALGRPQLAGEYRRHAESLEAN